MVYVHFLACGTANLLLDKTIFFILGSSWEEAFYWEVR